MVRALLLLVALGGGQVGAELDALDAEVAGLKRERAGANTFSDNGKRAELDRKIDLLERVRNRAERVLALRVDACMASGPIHHGGQPSQTQVAQAVACARAGQGSVAMVRRSEELKDLLKYGNWGWHNRDRRAALQKELEEIDRRLGD